MFFRVKSRWISGGVAPMVRRTVMMIRMLEKCPRRSSERCWHGLRGITEHVRSLWLSMRYRSNFRLWDLQSTDFGISTTNIQCQVQNRMSVAELKTLVKRPDVVEVWDTTASDPRLLVYLKAWTPRSFAKGPKNLKLNIITAWLGLLSLGLQLSLLLLLRLSAQPAEVLDKFD